MAPFRCLRSWEDSHGFLEASDAFPASDGDVDDLEDSDSFSCLAGGLRWCPGWVAQGSENLLEGLGRPSAYDVSMRARKSVRCLLEPSEVSSRT